MDPKTEEQIQRLYDEGFTDDEIAKRLAKSKSTIGQWRKRRGLPTVFENRKRLTDWESKQIQDFLAYERKFKIVTKEKNSRRPRKRSNCFCDEPKTQT